MKYFNQKIEKFLKWTEEEQGPIINEELFNLYCMESDEEVEPLTADEKKYLITLSKLRTQKMWSIGVIKGDYGKMSMINENGGTSEKTKQDVTGEVEYVTIVADGLLDEPTHTTEYEKINFKNEAVEELIKNKGVKN